MSTRTGLALFLAFAAVFLALNSGAYRSYFQDDEIDNLSWTPGLTPLEYLQGALTPVQQTNNFRPVGHFYFYIVEAISGLEFPVYVAVLQAFHLLNVWLLWTVMRRLDASPLAAVGACLFFGLHMALFDAVWKPMYIFDVLCATFCLLALWCWMERRWVLAFLCFWLAYKSKELAVMLPAVLALYEFWFGNRRWKPLVPFFLASLSFGLQGVLRNPTRDNDYTFRFTLDAVARTSTFYAGRIFLVPWLGFAVPLFALLARTRRVWFGLATMALFLVPLLFLPGRLFSAYCYLPFAALAIAISGLADTLSPAAIALFLVLWLPADLMELRTQRRATLADAKAVHAWMDAVENFSAGHGKLDAFIYYGSPGGFHPWGVTGALKYFFGRDNLAIAAAHTPEADALARTRRTALLIWDPTAKHLSIQVREPAPQ